MNSSEKNNQRKSKKDNHIYHLERRVSALFGVINDQFTTVIHFCLTLPHGGQALMEQMLRNLAILHTKNSFSSALFTESYGTPKKIMTAKEALRFVFKIHINEKLMENDWVSIEGSDKAFSVSYRKQDCVYQPHCNALVCDGFHCICVRRFFYEGIIKGITGETYRSEICTPLLDQEYCKFSFKKCADDSDASEEVRSEISKTLDENIELRNIVEARTKKLRKQNNILVNEINERKRTESFNKNNAEILEMVAKGMPTSDIFDAIALMYEERHPGMRCSILILEDNTLLYGSAPSLPKEYCESVNGLIIGPNIGSCGTSTYTGKRCLVDNIETDPKWATIKQVALLHGMRCCWSEPIKNSSGKVLGAFGMYYNHSAMPNEEESDDLKSAARLASIVIERDQNQKQILHLAYKDELTGLSSRAHFHQNLEKLIKVSERQNRRFSLLFIDLDDFKDINDSLGHDIGDLLLQEIANRLLKVNREVDIIARLGGDEFCIIIEDIKDDFVPAHIARRCLEKISEPIVLSSRKLIPSCSIGIAHYPADGENISALLKAADISLYAAKEKGKNCFTFYKPELTLKTEYRFQIEQYLREAIVKNQLSLVYQPQLKISTGDIFGVEALSRWNHPILGSIPPTEFIAIAERIGMIKPLTEWVLKTACSQAVAWKNAGLPALRMSVNISPEHFLDINLVSMIQSIIDETGMIPAELELEVTESVVQTNQQNLSIFQNLKEIGIKLAIDDFGTGYSSFASLKHLNVDCLKIDKYFIDDMLDNDKTMLLVKSMVEIGHNLEHGIIAEGVETIEQLNILKEISCEAAQGYLISKPVSADNISELMNNNNTFF